MKTKNAAICFSGKTFNRLIASLFVLTLMAGEYTLLNAQEPTGGPAVVMTAWGGELTQGLAAKARVRDAAATGAVNQEPSAKREAIAPCTAGDTIDLVGPSSEAIHAVLYPGKEAHDVD